MNVLLNKQDHINNNNESYCTNGFSILLWTEIIEFELIFFLYSLFPSCYSWRWSIFFLFLGGGTLFYKNVKSVILCPIFTFRKLVVQFPLLTDKISRRRRFDAWMRQSRSWRCWRGGGFHVGHDFPALHGGPGGQHDGRASGYGLWLGEHQPVLGVLGTNQDALRALRVRRDHEEWQCGCLQQWNPRRSVH